MGLELRRAERKKAKLRIGLGGPSGSGKTFSALLMANGMAPWEKIAMIDTENGSGELYSHLGAYNVITITPPFSPEVYIEAIKACEKAGMEVIVIDSITHEWDGQGGCLEIVDKLGGKYQDWGKVTPRHKAFIDTILQSQCHIITSVRKKQDYDMVKTSDGRTKVEKLGMKEITREGFEYELTLSFELMINHYAKASKDRTGLFMERPEFIISQKTGKELLDWANSGKANPNIEKITAEQIAKIQSQIKEMEADPVVVEQFIIKTKKVGMKELTEAQADEVIVAFEKKLETKKQEAIENQKTEDTLKEYEETVEGKEMTAEEAENELDEALGQKRTPDATVGRPVGKKDAIADALGLDEKDLSPAKKAMLSGMKKKSDIF